MYSRDPAPIEFCSQECLNQSTFLNGNWQMTSSSLQDNMMTFTMVYNKPIEYIQIEFNIQAKCECGADKCKTMHSDWCPKYEKL